MRRVVTHADLKKLADVSTSHFQLVDPALADEAVVLRGDFSQLCLRDGLYLHATEVHELHDLKTQSVQGPSLTFSIFLQGRISARIGERRFSLGRGAERSSQQFDATAISRVRPETFVRQSRTGAHIRKVNVTVTPEWLENSGLDGAEDAAAVRRFARTHLAFGR